VPNVPTDWIRMWAVTIWNRAQWAQNEALRGLTYFATFITAPSPFAQFVQ
jgi:hypothetical protein